MPKVCLTCSQDINDPCFGVLIYFTIPIGSSVVETDTVKVITASTVSSTGLIEISPFVNESASGDIFYQFNIILDGETASFIIYRRADDSQWVIGRRLDPTSAVYIEYATAPWGYQDACIFTQPLTWTINTTFTIGSTIYTVVPGFNINIIEQAVLPTPSENLNICDPPVNVPIDVNSKEYTAVRINDLDKCLISKGTDYLNKLKGGVACSNLELVKLGLIIELLKKKDCETALPCLYSRRDFPTTLYKGDSCSDLNYISGDRITLSGNFIGYAGANFNVTCGGTFPEVDYITPDAVCDACPAGYDLSVVNSQEICVQSTNGAASTTPASPSTATILAGNDYFEYNIRGLNLMQDVTPNLNDLPLSLTGSANGNYNLKRASTANILGDTGAILLSNLISYRNYSKQVGQTENVQANNPLFSTRSNWLTTNNSYGMLNYSGIWLDNTTADCALNAITGCDSAGDYIEIYKCLVIPNSQVNKTYLFGMAAEGAIKIEVRGPGFGNGTSFVEFIRFSTNNAAHTDTSQWYTVVPVKLQSGNYTFRVRAYNYGVGSASAVSLDIYNITVAEFKRNFCNTNLPVYFSSSAMQNILLTTAGSTAFPVGNVVNPANLAAKRAELWTYKIFSLRDSIGQTVYTQPVTYSCLLGGELNYCNNPLTATCRSITDTIPYYYCCDREGCLENLEGFSSEIMDVIYDPATDLSTLLLTDPIPQEAIGNGNTCINYCISYSPTPETYLETFVNYISKECRNCVTTTIKPSTSSPLVDAVPDRSREAITTSTGENITLENGSNITL